MICFACEEEYDDELEVCPFCGFRADDEDEELYCPYSIDGTCVLTEALCYKDIDFRNCQIREEVERGDIDYEL